MTEPAHSNKESGVLVGSSKMATRPVGPLQSGAKVN